MNKDLTDFLNEVTWVFTDINQINVLEEKIFKCPTEFEATFPVLTNLLKKARITAFNYGSRNYELFGWTNADADSYGWLCLEPDSGDVFDKQLHPDHLLLLKHFGGITERWNEPKDTWLENLNSALTYEDAQNGLNGNEEWLYKSCQEDGIEITLEPDVFISFAFEANGNVTMYHKQTGQVLMYASDHAFDFLTPHENYPEYTLYQIENCNTLKDWIETVANQWLIHLEN